MKTWKLCCLKCQIPSPTAVQGPRQARECAASPSLTSDTIEGTTRICLLIGHHTAITGTYRILVDRRAPAFFLRLLCKTTTANDKTLASSPSLARRCIMKFCMIYTAFQRTSCEISLWTSVPLLGRQAYRM